MEKIVALCKRRGYIYPGSEIYNGLTGTWDYGPLGTLLKNNLKNLWWKEMVQLRDDVVGIDAAIMMNPKAWEASGHVEAFTDPLIECKVCHESFREDKEDEIIVISTQGQVIRTSLKAIPTLNRQTQGVRVMNMHEGDTVAAMAVL